MEFSAKQIATFIQGEIVGDENATVHTFAKIEEGIPGAISFLSNPKYTSYIYETQASIVLVNKDFVPEQEIKATLIKVDNAYESLAKLLNLYEQSKPKRVGIDPLAFVAETAKIGKDVYIAPFACIGEYAEVGDNTMIHPHATIGSGAKIGSDCILYANTTIYHDCRIGNHCILHSGCVIGADGFGFANSRRLRKNTSNRYRNTGRQCRDRCKHLCRPCYNGGNHRTQRCETGQPDTSSPQ